MAHGFRSRAHPEGAVIVTYDSPPSGIRALNQRLMNLENDATLVTRRRTTMALVIVGQMLPDGAVKGGSAMALRYGVNSRFTRDLDAARTEDAAQFRAEFEDNLRQGWEGFTGRLIERTAPAPAGVPTAYVMQPFDIKLDYRGQPWCTVPFELGHNEIGDADHPEPVLSDDSLALFATVGLPKPAPVPVMPADHQIAQKLHACTSEGNDRARDLVDLQLLAERETLDLVRVRTTCERVFKYRRSQAWPPAVTGGEHWDTLYADAAAGLDVAAHVDEAIDIVNGLIQLIDNAT